MPFSTVFVPFMEEAHLLAPVELANTDQPRAVELPPGVSQVIVTWRGIDPITIRHYRTGGSYEIIHRIPAATSPTIRTSGVLTLSAATSHNVQIVHGTSRANQWEQSTLDSGFVAGVQIIPLSTPGGV